MKFVLRNTKFIHELWKNDLGCTVPSLSCLYLFTYEIIVIMVLWGGVYSMIIWMISYNCSVLGLPIPKFLPIPADTDTSYQVPIPIPVDTDSSYQVPIPIPADTNTSYQVPIPIPDDTDTWTKMPIPIPILSRYQWISTHSQHIWKIRLKLNIRLVANYDKIRKIQSFHVNN